MGLKLEPFVQGPFVGMRDSIDPQSARPELAYNLQNTHPRTPRISGGMVGRPGFNITEANQLGSTNNRDGMLLYQFSKLDGTEYSIAFTGAKMYTYNWSTAAWSEVTLSGVSLTTNTRIYAVTFADKILVNPNDGTNKPWTWDGTTFTSLTNASTWYGQPVVYYAKVFGIQWASRTSLEWSEEGDPTIGYGSSWYNNVWELRQTDQEPMQALYAKDDALYYWRKRTAGAIYGAVSTTFSSTGVKEGVSETHGTSSPGGVIGHNGRMFFIDSEKRFHYIPSGSVDVVPIWEDLAEFVDAMPAGKLSKVETLTYPWADLVMFGVHETSSSTENDAIVCFHNPPDSEPRFAGVWRGFSFNTLGLLKNSQADDFPTLVHQDTDGRVYKHGYPDGSNSTIWKDALNSGDVAITHIVEGPYAGSDVLITGYQWENCRMSFRLDTALTVTVDITTPDGSQSLPPTALTLGSAPEEQAIEVGIGDYGRWARAKITHNTINERFGFNRMILTGYAEPLDPSLK